MSKRARSDTRDRVVLDVGGTRFTTSISTLSANSTYFASMCSRWEPNEEVFLDRDPDVFRVLLSCMRQRKPLLPENDKDLFKRAVLDAEFLGIEWLLNEIKVRVFDHEEYSSQHDIVSRYNDSCDDEADHLVLSGGLGPEAKVKLFDFEYTSIDGASTSGALPAQFFKRRAVGADTIKQLIPCPKDDTVVFFDERDGEDQSRTALCFALVENMHGRTRIEPVVRGRGIEMPHSDVRAGAAWNTTEPEDQLVTASAYMGDAGEDRERHWGYAYKGEVANRGISEKLNR